MNLTVNNSQNFKATLRPSSALKYVWKDRQSQKNVKALFAEATKGKEGELGIFEESTDMAEKFIMRIGRGTIGNHIYRPQSAYASEAWTYDFLNNKNDFEKADILTKVFEILQTIPKKIEESMLSREYCEKNYNKVIKSLGDDKYNLAHMFEHLKTNGKKNTSKPSCLMLPITFNK